MKCNVDQSLIKVNTASQNTTALSEEMSLPLCMIFKKSLDEGVVPLDWGAANVVPLYIKGSKNFQVILDQ